MDYTAWTEAVTNGLTEMTTLVVGYLPRILAAAAILLAGWLIAKVLRVVGVRLIGGLDRLWHGLLVRVGMESLQARHPPAKIVGEIIFWLVILFFLTAAAEILGLGVFVTWGAQLVSYLPLLLAGLLIVLVGFIMSSLVYDFVTATAMSAGVAQAEVLGRSAQGLVLLSAIVVGVDQIGVDIGFLATLAIVIAGTLLGGVALAFGIGARTFVSNAIAGHQLRQLYQVGDTVRVQDVEGKILEITATAVIMEAAEGRVVVPAGLFDSTVSVRVTRGEHAGG